MEIKPFESSVKQEREFLESIEEQPNNHNSFVYYSQDKSSLILLDAILAEYKLWMDERGLNHK